MPMTRLTASRDHLIQANHTRHLPLPLLRILHAPHPESQLGHHQEPNILATTPSQQHQLGHLEENPLHRVQRRGQIPQRRKHSVAEPLEEGHGLHKRRKHSVAKPLEQGHGLHESQRISNAATNAAAKTPRHARHPC